MNFKNLFGKQKKEKGQSRKAKKQSDSDSNLIDLISPAGLKIEHNQFTLSGKYGRSFFVLNYPQSLTDGWLSPLITLDRETNISLFLHPTKTNVVLRNLTKKTAKLQSQMSMRAEKGKVRSPKLQTALENVENLRNKLQEGTERLFRFGFYITFFANSKDELDDIENEIRAVLENQSVHIKPTIFQQEQGLVSTLPLEQDKIANYNSLNTSPLSSAFPFVSSNLTDDKGVLYGINRHNNSLILFDRFSLPNSNMCVFATSGAGKSYAIKLEALRSLMMGTEVIIIDPEREYKYLAETVGGTFLDISLTSPNHLNPFDLPIPSADERPADVLRGNIINLTGLLKLMLGDISAEEEAILDTALTETYASRDITPESDFSKITPPTMEDLQIILRGITGAESLVQRLDKFVSGSYSKFFNQQTNIELGKKLVVFSIRDMEDQLRPLAMYIILRYIWNLVRSDKRKRIMVVDEAWWMMQYKESAAFLFGVAKRARKYYLGLTTITQDVADFLHSEYGKPILTNSSLQLLMKQSSTAIELIQKAFNLTEQEKYLLLECAVGEGMLFANNKHASIKIVASYSEDQIITTDPRQLLEIEEAKKEIEQEDTKENNKENSKEEQEDIAY